MDKISSKCDCCGSFGFEDEFEIVTIKIKKHPDCKVNQLFGKVEIKHTPLDLPRVDTNTTALPPSMTVPSSVTIPSYMGAEMAKIHQTNKEFNG